jgi:polyisoprenoid-binding protein YceI
MKKYILYLRYSLFLFLGFTLAGAGVPVESTYTLTKAYSVTILGTTNVRNWKDSVGNVTGNMVAELEADGSVDLRAIRIEMEVRSIKSDMGPVMDNRTYRSLKADANPEILFLLTVPVKLAQVRPGEQPLNVKGNLTLAGVCRPVTMRVNSFTLGQGKLRFEGSQTISMTDYGVKPPTALFGTIRAHAGITIQFKTNFTNKQSKS